MEGSRREQKQIIGTDVGGTKIAACLADPDGKILASVRRPTDLTNAEATLDSIADTVKELIATRGLESREVEAIGFGIPGLVDAEQGIGLASVNLGWRNVRVRSGLEARLGVRCAIDNDVRVGALGEARFGAARGLSNWIYLNIGTGISVVITLDGKVFSGMHGLAGEIGHAVLVPDGPRCKCGGKGCFEAVSSGPAIAERALAKIRAGRPSLLAPQGPSLVQEDITAEAVFGYAALGDAVSVETLEEVGMLTAYALQYIALAFDPELIVIGGGVLGGSPMLFEAIQHKLRELSERSWVYGRSYSRDLVRLSALGNNAGLLGAAALAAQLS